MDIFTPEKRREVMQAIKGKDTTIEMMLRKKLWEKGYRYRKNYNKIVGKPDIVFPKYKIAIFCDSTFWHGYNWEEKETVGTNRNTDKKIERNWRGQRINQDLIAGLIVLRF